MKTSFGVALVAVILALPRAAWTDDGPAPAQDKPAADKVDQAIGRAIDFLVSLQDKDGAIDVLFEDLHENVSMNGTIFDLKIPKDTVVVPMP